MALVEEIEINCPEDYMQFIPYDLGEQFTSKDFAKAAHIPVALAQTTIHILHYVGVIKQIGKQGRSYLYEVVW